MPHLVGGVLLGADVRVPGEGRDGDGAAAQVGTPVAVAAVQCELAAETRREPAGHHRDEGGSTHGLNHVLLVTELVDENVRNVTRPKELSTKHCESFHIIRRRPLTPNMVVSKRPFKIISRCERTALVEKVLSEEHSKGFSLYHAIS